MKHRMSIHLLRSRVHDDFADLRELVAITETHLKKETTRLAAKVAKELNQLPEEQKEFATGWYADDFVRLDRVFPGIQRRALFITLMCMTEADILLVCEMCRRAYELPRPFKKKRNQGLIAQALAYLQDNLTIQMRSLKDQWDIVQNLWSIRNTFVHNDGKPRSTELEGILKFCAPIPTVVLDHHNRIILHRGSVEMALHAVDLFFSQLLDEIDRNKLPPEDNERKKEAQAIGDPGSPQPEACR